MAESALEVRPLSRGIVPPVQEKRQGSNRIRILGLAVFEHDSVDSRISNNQESRLGWKAGREGGSAMALQGVGANCLNLSLWPSGLLQSLPRGVEQAQKNQITSVWQLLLG